METVTHNDGSNKRGLLPQHRTDLLKSGLSDAQIGACGFYSECDPKTIAGLLGGHFTPASAARLGPCLVIPYLAPDGTPTGYARLKPDRPPSARAATRS